MKTLKMISFCCLTLIATGSAYADTVPSCPTIASGTTLEAAIPTIGTWGNELLKAIPAGSQASQWKVSVASSGDDNCLFTLDPTPENTLPSITTLCTKDGLCTLQPQVAPAS